MKKIILLFLIIIINSNSYSQEFFFGDSHIHKPEIINIEHNTLISTEVRVLTLVVPNETSFPLKGIMVKLGNSTKIYQVIDGVDGSEITDFSTIVFLNNIPNTFKAVSSNGNYGYIYSLTVLKGNINESSTENILINFSFVNKINANNSYIGVVNSDANVSGSNTIAIDIPSNINLEDYKYVMVFSDNARVSPINDSDIVLVNNKATITVKSESNSERNYILTVNRTNTAEITKIRIEDNTDANKFFETDVTTTGSTTGVSLDITEGVDISNYKYIFTLSAGATVDPVNGATLGTDYADNTAIPIEVTSSDGNTINTYNLTIKRVEASPARSVSITEPITLAYYPSWNDDWANPGKNSKLREVPSYVNTIFLSFALPNMRYTKGSYDLSGTGIQSQTGGQLHESIRALNNKGIRVILSVGGENYWNGATEDNPNAAPFDIRYNEIKDFVDDFEIAGIDWDYEPDKQIHILSQQFHIDKFIEFVTKSRAIMPRGEYLIACAPSGVGALGGVGPIPSGVDDPSSPYNNAYGQTLGDMYASAETTPAYPATLFGFTASGHFIPVMEAVGDMIDIVAYQGYNVGGSSDRKVMYDSFSYYANTYGFVVVAGVHVAEEPYGPHYYFNNENVADLAEYIYKGGAQNRTGKNDGIMLWELLAEDRSVSNNTGLGFMKLSYEILRGTTKADAIILADTASPDPYSGGAEVSGGGGTLHCGIPEWSASEKYEVLDIIVYHNGKIWKNRWWIKEEEPGSNITLVWIYVEDCTE